MALTDNLVAFWELEEASGNRTDSVASIVLTDTNTVTSTTGKVGTAAQFTLANLEDLDCVDNAALSMGDIDFTIQAWAYFDDVAFTHVLVSKGNGLGGTLEYGLYADDTPAIKFRVDGGGSTFPTVTSSVTPSTSTWYHIIAWHDSVDNEIGIAVNAGTAVTSAYSGGSQDTAQPFYLGYDGSSGRWHNGRLDQVGIWKRVLTSGERTSLYNSGSGLSYAAMSGGGGGGSQNLFYRRRR